KFEETRQLASVKSPIDISETARFNRRRAGDARLFFPHRVEEIQWLAAFESLHVPMGKSAIHWISQKDEQFDLWVVFPDPSRRRLVIYVTWRAITCDLRGSEQRIMFVQLLIVQVRNEHRVVIEEMHFLLVA